MARLVVTGALQQRILVIRGHRVMLDSDLAALYGVPIKVLNQSVHRNRERFPKDFMFQLDRGEADSVRSQFVTLELGRGRHRKYLPYAFTEQGVAMLSSVLRSRRAILGNIAQLMTPAEPAKRRIGFHAHAPAMASALR